MAQEDENSPLNEITFHYIKNEQFRTLYADGAYGGITPQNKLHIAFYLERGPIPLTVTQELKLEGITGSLGRDLSVTGRKGIVREIESSIVMDLDAAERVADWILKTVKAYRDAKKEAHE